MAKINFIPLRGMRDFSPEEVFLREKIIKKIKSCFELFGFKPLETPSLEKWDILSAKGGGGKEILKETYSFEDRSGRKVGLIYDLTIPLARFAANNPNIPLPFKRYQIQKVWRYGDVKRGRLREFYQCDIDVVGSNSMLADVECVACAIFCLEKLGFKNFKVKLSNRKILTALVKYAGVEESKVVETFRAIDKLDKIGIDGVKSELKKIELKEETIEKIIELINLSGEEALEKAEKLLGEGGKEGIEELREFLKFSDMFKIKDKILIDFSLARGLDYYTGPIFEIWSEEKIGSLAGGGRYNNLIEIFAKRKIPATGISLGIERIIELIKSEQKIEKKTPSRVFIATVSSNFMKNAIEIANYLRKRGIECEFDLMKRNLSKQLEYVDKLNIPLVIIIGKEEIERKVVKIRNMKTGEEKLIEINELEKFLK